MSGDKKFKAKRLQLAARSIIIVKKLQQICVKKAAHSLTVYNEGNCRIYFLPNFRKFIKVLPLWTSRLIMKVVLLKICYAVRLERCPRSSKMGSSAGVSQSV